MVLAFPREIDEKDKKKLISYFREKQIIHPNVEPHESNITVTKFPETRGPILNDDPKEPYIIRSYEYVADHGEPKIIVLYFKSPDGQRMTWEEILDEREKLNRE